VTIQSLGKRSTERCLPLWKMAAPSYDGVTSLRRKPEDAGST